MIDNPNAAQRKLMKTTKPPLQTYAPPIPEYKEGPIQSRPSPGQTQAVKSASIRSLEGQKPETQAGINLMQSLKRRYVLLNPPKAPAPPSTKPQPGRPQPTPVPQTPQTPIYDVQPAMAKKGRRL